MTTITKGIRILDYDIIVQLRNTDSNCIVYKAEDPKTKKQFILKLIYRPLLHPDLFHFLKNEYKTHVKSRHPNLVPIKKYRSKDQQGFLIYDFCEQGNLEGYLQRRSFNVSMPIKLYLIRELLSTYLEVKKLGFFGRDLKLHNVLISNNVFKIGDVENLMKSHYSLKKNMYNYMPPEEILLKTTISDDLSFFQKRDIWCLGVNIFYILFGKLPFQGDNKTQILINIQEKVGLEKNPLIFFSDSDTEKTYQSFYGILSQTLKYEPQDRMEIEELLKSEVFQSQNYESPIYDKVTLEEEEEKGNFLVSLFSDNESIKSYGLAQGILQMKQSINSEKGPKLEKKLERNVKVYDETTNCCFMDLFKAKNKKK